MPANLFSSFFVIMVPPPSVSLSAVLYEAPRSIEHLSGGYVVSTWCTEHLSGGQVVRTRCTEHLSSVPVADTHMAVTNRQQQRGEGFRILTLHIHFTGAQEQRAHPLVS